MQRIAKKNNSTVSVLHINNNYTATTLHQIMLEHLNNIKIKSQVFVPVYDKKKSVIDVIENVYVSECFKKWNRYLFDLKQQKIINSIKRSFDVTKFTCIHAYTLFTDGNCAMRLSKQYGIPYIVAVRNTDVNDFFAKRILLRNRGVRIMENASVIIFLSESYRKNVISKYVPSHLRENILKKSIVIPNGIDDFWLDNRYTDKDLKITEERFKKKKISVVYAGSIDKNKNLATSVKCIEILRKMGWDASISIAGEVKDKAEVKKIENRKYINFLGKKSREELLEFYRTGDIFLMPSLTESFGLVYAEAMSQGLPVIYSKGQGFDTQFEEGQVGYHVNSLDANDIVNAILKITEEYERIYTNCINDCLRFDWNIIIQRYKEIYEYVCK